MTTGDPIDPQKIVIDAAVQWVQILEHLTSWRLLAEEHQLETRDLLSAAEVLSRSRYKRLLSEYVNEQITTDLRQRTLEEEVAALLDQINKKDPNYATY